MTNKVNLIIFIGLVISGSCIFFGYVISFLFPAAKLFAKISIYGDFSGWFFVFLATISFLIGSASFLFGRIKNFWNNFYPLNIGLTLLGLSFASYNTLQHPFSLITLSFVFAIILALIFHRLALTQYRLFLLLLIISVFIYNSWSGFMGGIIFISLSIASDVSKTIFGSFKGQKKPSSNRVAI